MASPVVRSNHLLGDRITAGLLMLGRPVLGVLGRTERSNDLVGSVVRRPTQHDVGRRRSEPFAIPMLGGPVSLRISRIPPVRIPHH